MMAKFENSWRLFKASISVTFKYRKLLWFPILITFLTVFIALFFLSAMVIPAVAAHHWLALNKYLAPTPAVGAAYALCVPLVYLLSMLLATFFNVAFYSEIIAALNGKGVSFRRGLASASRPIAFDCCLVAFRRFSGMAHSQSGGASAVRGTNLDRIYRAGLEHRGCLCHSRDHSGATDAQSLKNPPAIRHDVEESLGRKFGWIRRVFCRRIGDFSVARCCRFVSGACSGLPFKSVWLIDHGGHDSGLLGLLLMAYISGVAGHVYRCALYLYAAEGVIPEPYNQEMLDMAWKVKKA